MEINELIEKEFEKRNFKPQTRKAYSEKLNGLFKFYEHIEPSNINFDQIDSYLFRQKKKASPSYIQTSFWAYKLFFNEVLGKNFPFFKLRLPQTDSAIPELLSQKEIKDLLASLENLKHRTLITLLYSTGIRMDELQALVPKDILSDKKQIRVRNIKTGKIRYPYLSNRLLLMLREYYTEYKPKKYLFEGQKAGTQYSETSMRKILEKARINANISSEITLSGLRYCYVKHMVEQGQSLPALLKSMNVTSSDNVDFYYKLCGKSEQIDFSPIDKLGVILETNAFETEDIQAVFDSIEDLDERDYLRESIACFKVGALRAGVVFVWASAIRNLQNKCTKKGFGEINKALLEINARERPIKQLSDFERLKDKTSLDIAYRIGVISKHQKGELEKHLDLRNYCGHPSDYELNDTKIKAYLADLVNMIFKNKNT